MQLLPFLTILLMLASRGAGQTAAATSSMPSSNAVATVPSVAVSVAVAEDAGEQAEESSPTALEHRRGRALSRLNTRVLEMSTEHKPLARELRNLHQQLERGREGEDKARKALIEVVRRFDEGAGPDEAMAPHLREIWRDRRTWGQFRDGFRQAWRAEEPNWSTFNEAMTEALNDVDYGEFIERRVEAEDKARREAQRRSGPPAPLVAAGVFAVSYVLLRALARRH